jgi:NitT/TauT family transport system permease protein
MKYSGLMRGLLSLIVLGLTWELSVRLGILDDRFTPPFTSVISTGAHELLNGHLIFAVGGTIGSALIALASASIIAIPLGLFVGISTTARQFVLPVIESLRPIPSVALIPVFVLLFGIGAKPIYLIGVLGCMWPILLAAMYGVRQMDEVLLQVIQTMKIPLEDVFVKVILPASLPSIFSGIRISLAISMISTVTGEMVLGIGGIGAYILEKERSFKFAEMYAAIGALALIGIALNWLFAKLERKWIFWTEEKNLL